MRSCLLHHITKNELAEAEKFVELWPDVITTTNAELGFW